MTHLRTLLLLAVVIVHLAYSVYQLDRPIMIAALLPEDDRRPFSIGHIRPAIELAVEKVQAPGGLLEALPIEINYADSMCSSADSMNEAINFYVRNSSHIFLGPCCDYGAAPVGRQTKYWNIPMITTALARDFAVYKKDKYPMMTRLGSSINKMGDFFSEMLKEFGWSKVKIVYQPSGMDHILDHMCHVTAESLHYILTEMYSYLVPYYKFEVTREVLANLQAQIGTENAGPDYCVRIHFPNSTYVMHTSGSQPLMQSLSDFGGIINHIFIGPAPGWEQVTSTTSERYR